MWTAFPEVGLELLLLFISLCTTHMPPRTPSFAGPCRNSNVILVKAAVWDPQRENTFVTLSQVFLYDARTRSLGSTLYEPIWTTDSLPVSPYIMGWIYHTEFPRRGLRRSLARKQDWKDNHLDWTDCCQTYCVAIQIDDKPPETLLGYADVNPVTTLCFLSQRHVSPLPFTLFLWVISDLH